jgi:hypothetical protein
VCGVFKAEAAAYFQRNYARMMDAGCDAMVLGYSEIPLMDERRQLTAPDPRLDSERGDRLAEQQQKDDILSQLHAAGVDYIRGGLTPDEEDVDFAQRVQAQGVKILRLAPL